MRRADQEVYPSQKIARKENCTTRGPPPTRPAVVPTAVATALPTVAVILPKFALLWLLTGLEKFVWLNRLNRSARNCRRVRSPRSGKFLAAAKSKLTRPGP